MSDLGSKGLAVHQEKLDILLVVDKESLVPGGHHVAGLLCGTIADLGHGGPSSEATADSTVNSLRLAPAARETFETVTLVSRKRGLVLLGDGNHLGCDVMSGLSCR